MSKGFGSEIDMSKGFGSSTQAQAKPMFGAQPSEKQGGLFGSSNAFTLGAKSGNLFGAQPPTQKLADIVAGSKTDEKPA